MWHMAWDQCLDEMIYFFSEFRKKLTKFCPIFDSTIKAIEKPCQHDILIIA